MREDVSVLQMPRGAGKTTWVMEQIHALAIQNRTHEVLVVLSNRRHREFWLNTWRDKYPALSAPMVVTMANLSPIRGRRYPKIFVEDIDTIVDGIYDEKLWISITPCLDWAREPEVVFTCSPLDLVFPSMVDKKKEKQAALERHRRRYQEVIARYIEITGEMPKLPDNMMNPERYESNDTID